MDNTNIIVVDVGDVGNVGDVGDLADLDDVGDVGDVGDLGDLGDVGDVGDVADNADVGDFGDVVDICDTCSGESDGTGTVIDNDVDKHELEKVGRVLNISWGVDGASQPVNIICPRSTSCPRTDLRLPPQLTMQTIQTSPLEGAFSRHLLRRQAFRTQVRKEFFHELKSSRFGFENAIHSQPISIDQIVCLRRLPHELYECERIDGGIVCKFNTTLDRSYVNPFDTNLCGRKFYLRHTQ